MKHRYSLWRIQIWGSACGLSNSAARCRRYLVNAADQSVSHFSRSDSVLQSTVVTFDVGGVARSSASPPIAFAVIYLSVIWEQSIQILRFAGKRAPNTGSTRRRQRLGCVLSSLGSCKLVPVWEYSKRRVWKRCSRQKVGERESKRREAKADRREETQAAPTVKRDHSDALSRVKGALSRPAHARNLAPFSLKFK